VILEHAILAVATADVPTFESRISEACSILLRSPGCVSADIRPTLDRPGQYLLTVGWGSLADHLETFAASPAAAELHDLIGSLFAETPIVVHVEASS
jgi:quinol monooxygenase YgiN